MPCDIERLPFTLAAESNAEADTPAGSRPHGGRGRPPSGPTARSPGAAGASRLGSARVELLYSDEHRSSARGESPAAGARHVVSGGIGAKSCGDDGLVALQSLLRISPAGLP